MCLIGSCSPTLPRSRCTTHAPSRLSKVKCVCPPGQAPWPPADGHHPSYSQGHLWPHLLHGWEPGVPHQGNITHMPVCLYQVPVKREYNSPTTDHTYRHKATRVLKWVKKALEHCDWGLGLWQQPTEVQIQDGPMLPYGPPPGVCVCVCVCVSGPWPSGYFFMKIRSEEHTSELQSR